jgi:hypothetical protein
MNESILLNEMIENSEEQIPIIPIPIVNNQTLTIIVQYINDLQKNNNNFKININITLFQTNPNKVCLISFKIFYFL